MVDVLVRKGNVRAIGEIVSGGGTNRRVDVRQVTVVTKPCQMEVRPT
jgi:hypothetical protein